MMMMMTMTVLLILMMVFWQPAKDYLLYIPQRLVDDDRTMELYKSEARSLSVAKHVNNRFRLQIILT